jgi:hypothetical protein
VTRGQLIVGINGGITAEQAEGMRTDLAGRLPDIDVTIISQCSTLLYLPPDQDTDR